MLFYKEINRIKCWSLAFEHTQVSQAFPRSMILEDTCFVGYFQPICFEISLHMAYTYVYIYFFLPNIHNIHTVFTLGFFLPHFSLMISSEYHC